MVDLRALVAGARQGVDPTEAREAARDILSGPEYAEPRPSVVERAADWIFDRLGSFFGTLTGGGPGSVIGWLIVLALVLGAMWLFVRALRLPAVPGAVRTDGPVYGTETRWDPDEWRRQAARLEAGGDLRGALRCRYQALIASMVVGRVVDDLPGRTTEEHRRLLTDRLPRAATPLAEINSTFEATWYGGAPVDVEDLRRFQEACEAVEQHAADPAPVPA